MIAKTTIVQSSAVWERAKAVIPETLTPRMREVAQLIAESRNPKEIALELKVDYKTAEWHCNQLFNRLGLPKGRQYQQTHLAIATRWAIHHHLCHPECVTP